MQARRSGSRAGFSRGRFRFHGAARLKPFGAFRQRPGGAVSPDDREINSAFRAAPPPAPTDDRSQLVSRLFQEHNRALVRKQTARLHCEQEARDVAQEAYVRLLQLEEPGAVSFLKAYLFRIASNLAVDRIRQRAVHGRVLSQDLFADLTDPHTTAR